MIRSAVRLRSLALFMNFFVYALYSAKLDVVYIGQTKDLDKRLSDHKKGYSKYTSRSDDWIMFYSEDCDSRANAMLREGELKSSKGRRFLRKLYEQNEANRISGLPEGR